MAVVIDCDCDCSRSPSAMDGKAVIAVAAGLGSIVGAVSDFSSAAVGFSLLSKQSNRVSDWR